MENVKYSEKFKDPRWQKKRLEIFKRDGWACRYCFDADSMLAVHHTFYKPNYDPWDYPDASLITLCKSCHEAETELRGEANSILIAVLQELPYTSVEDLATSIHKMFHGHYGYPNEVLLSIATWMMGDSSVFHNVSEMYFKKLTNTKQEITLNE